MQLPTAVEFSNHRGVSHSELRLDHALPWLNACCTQPCTQPVLWSGLAEPVATHRSSPSGNLHQVSSVNIVLCLDRSCCLTAPVTLFHVCMLAQSMACTHHETASSLMVATRLFPGPHCKQGLGTALELMAETCGIQRLACNNPPQHSPVPGRHTTPGTSDVCCNKQVTTTQAFHSDDHQTHYALSFTMHQPAEIGDRSPSTAGTNWTVEQLDTTTTFSRIYAPVSTACLGQKDQGTTQTRRCRAAHQQRLRQHKPPGYKLPILPQCPLLHAATRGSLIPTQHA